MEVLKRHSRLFSILGIIALTAFFHFSSRQIANKRELDTYHHFVNAELLQYMRLHACKNAADQIGCFNLELSHIKSDTDKLVEIMEKKGADEQLKGVIHRYQVLDSISN